MYDEEELEEDEKYVVDNVIDEIEEIEQGGEITELRKKEEYLKVNSKCPKCDCHTLEYQIYGYEKNVFCTNCPYSKIITLN